MFKDKAFRRGLKRGLGIALVIDLILWVGGYWSYPFVRGMGIAIEIFLLSLGLFCLVVALFLIIFTNELS